MEEKDGATGDVDKSYTLGLDVISQADDSSNIYHFLYDGHGSTRALLNTTGGIVSGQVFAYDAYGNRIDLATALTTHLYSGERTDSATGLQYLRFRYYNPGTGRFNRLDPFAGNIDDPQSLHKYLYTHGDPTNNTDPTGQWSLGGTIASIGIQAGMTAMMNSVISTIAISNIFLAEQDKMPSGLMFSYGVSASSKIVVGTVGVASVNWYKEFGGSLSLLWTAELGLAPLANFKSGRGFDFKNWSFGAVWNADTPDALLGYSAIATTPFALFVHNTNPTSAGSWWSAMMYLARVKKGNIGRDYGSFQSVQSLTSSTAGFFYAFRQQSFSTTIGYTRFLSDSSKTGLVGSVLQRLNSLMSTVSDDPQKVPYIYNQIENILG